MQLIVAGQKINHKRKDNELLLSMQVLSCYDIPYIYTAVSTKVVSHKRKSARDNADLYYG